MIRTVAVSEDGHAVYGLTIRGIAVLGAALGAIVTAVIIGVFAFAHANDATSSAGRLADRNCRNIGGLAGIERTFIQQQQRQTTGLLERGYTFGIPKDQIGPLVKASEANNAAFLASFDALALTNC